MEILSVVSGVLLVVLLVVSLLVYRNWRYEQELDSLLWKVDYKDIKINDNEDVSGGKNARVCSFRLALRRSRYAANNQSVL